ncbi:MAG TPA: HAD family acid phosphatase, partial [Thermoanaerobaculia bacterium]
LVFLAACVSGGPAAPPAPVASTTPCNPGVAIVNSSLWVQSAAEYDAAALSVFNNARRAVEAALAQSPEPAAVIVDADETVLDNTQFEARMVHQRRTYDSKEWLKWVNESDARAVPGAVEFTTWAASKGVPTFYITNRKKDEEAGTTENLRRLGFPLSATEDRVLVRGERAEWEPRDKGPRRDFVASRYRVAAVLGDDLNDFVNTQGKSAAERDALVRANADKWGRSWFIVPNPIYGSWEDVIAGEGSPCEKLERKIEALVP